MAESEITTIARPYARAAFAQAMDADGGLATWSLMLGTLSAAMGNPTVRVALDSPLLGNTDRAAVLIDLCSKEMNDLGRNFVNLLAEYDRLLILPSVSEQFELLKANQEKTVEVQITSAYEVTQDERERLAESLKARLSRDINLATVVDKSLLGGIVIRAEDTVIDNSVRGKLEKLARVLG